MTFLCRIFSIKKRDSLSTVTSTESRYYVLFVFTIQYDDAMRLTAPRLIMSCLVTIGYFLKYD